MKDEELFSKFQNDYKLTYSCGGKDRVIFGGDVYSLIIDIAKPEPEIIYYTVIRKKMTGFLIEGLLAQNFPEIYEKAKMQTDKFIKLGYYLEMLKEFEDLLCGNEEWITKFKPEKNDDIKRYRNQIEGIFSEIIKRYDLKYIDVTENSGVLINEKYALEIGTSYTGININYCQMLPDGQAEEYEITSIIQKRLTDENRKYLISNSVILPVQEKRAGRLRSFEGCLRECFDDWLHGEKEWIKKYKKTNEEIARKNGIRDWIDSKEKYKPNNFLEKILINYWKK